jgi:hypothetical protein
VTAARDALEAAVTLAECHAPPTLQTQFEDGDLRRMLVCLARYMNAVFLGDIYKALLTCVSCCI